MNGLASASSDGFRFVRNTTICGDFVGSRLGRTTPLRPGDGSEPSNRNGHANIHVRGYKEEGTTTTPFDMVMLNDMDRFHLVIDVIDHLPTLGASAAHVRQHMADERLRHRAYTREVGDDMPDVRDWTWPGNSGVETPTDTLRGSST